MKKRLMKAQIMCTISMLQAEFVIKNRSTLVHQ